MTQTTAPATERVVGYHKGISYWTLPQKDGSFIELAQELLPAMTSSQSAEYVSQDGFQSPSARDFVSKVCATLYDLRNTGSEAENAMKFIRSMARANFLNLQTGFRYNPKSKDRVMQDYGRKNQDSIAINFVGSDGRLTDVLSLEACLALTGSKPEEVEQIMEYINGTPSWAWRLNSKPTERVERVAGFVVDPLGASFYCDWLPDSVYPSLGVRVARKK